MILLDEQGEMRREKAEISSNARERSENVDDEEEDAMDF